MFIADNELNDFNKRLNYGGGAELIKKVREKYPNKPIISLSGYNDKIPGANVHLVKPISCKIIEEEIRRLLI